MDKKWKPLFLCILIPLAVGGLASFLTQGDMAAFETVKKPPLAPPAWVFPVVWAILYVLMGVSSWLIYRKSLEDPAARIGLMLYGLQLLVNFLWPIFFFGLEWYIFSFLWLILLFYLVLQCIMDFAKWDKTAARLLIPYVIWLIIAGYLNFWIAVYN